MVFVNNFVHADLHPGNILIRGLEVDKHGLGHFFPRAVFVCIYVEGERTVISVVCVCG